MIHRHFAHLLLIACGGMIGCQQPLRPVFDEADRAIAWPPAPDRPRIQYIGALQGETSLGKPKPVTLKTLLSGPEPTMGFSTPMSVVVRGDAVYVADGQSHAVYYLNLVTREFRTITRVGSESLRWPIDVTFAEDQLVIVDSEQAAVFLLDGAARLARVVGRGVLKRPSAAAWDSKGRVLWVLDSAAHACIAFDAGGQEKLRVGGRGDSAGQFNFPAGLAWDSKVGLLIADSMNFRVQLLDEMGVPVGGFGRKGDAAGDFSLPRDVATDSEGHIYVLDNQFENIQVFDREGRLLMAWGQEGRGPGQFYLPSGIFIDERDRIWVADTYNRRVQVFQYLPEPAMAHGDHGGGRDGLQTASHE